MGSAMLGKYISHALNVFQSDIAVYFTGIRMTLITEMIEIAF